eukprot:2830756-Amphidinium_carterae.1
MGSVDSNITHEREPQELSTFVRRSTEEMRESTASVRRCLDLQSRQCQAAFKELTRKLELQPLQRCCRSSVTAERHFPQQDA